MTIIDSYVETSSGGFDTVSYETDEIDGVYTTVVDSMTANGGIYSYTLKSSVETLSDGAEETLTTETTS
jgi:hypothetical protein